jgi:hypothetical protein
MADARSDLDQLLSFMLPFAKQMLNKNAAFYPYAAVLTETDEIEPVADVPDDRPDPNELLTHLGAAIGARAARGGVRACAIGADVTITPPDADKPTDAVRVELEHVEDDEATVVFQPYQRTWRGVKLGELFATRKPREVLPPQSGTP